MKGNLLTKDERAREFKRLFNTIPMTRNVDRIRWAAAKLLLAENTIRIYLMRDPPRVPPELSIRVLREEIKKAKNK